jgi:molybdate/tungstate transport system ATP-binding protein
VNALTLADVSLKLGAFTLREISFALPAHEILVVVGPNGAGKSVLLETIAGFHRSARGRILIGDRDVTGLPPERRRVGFLVQNFGLFPHLNVAQNIAVAAEANRGADEGPDVFALLARFGIAHLADASPLVLSPGEKQRAALARAEASHPDLFLLDEPFAALDVQARDELRLELSRFLREMRAPALFVTHDRADVAALGDRVAIMCDGKILQCGTASDVFRRPASRAVAGILGFENILAGDIEGAEQHRVRINVAGHALEAEAGDRARAGTGVYVAIRAEAVRLAPRDRVPAIAAENRLAAKVVTLHCLGALTKVTLDSGFRLVACLMTRDADELRLAPGAPVVALIPAADVHVLVL